MSCKLDFRFQVQLISHIDHIGSKEQHMYNMVGFKIKFSNVRII
jgi:hypothetical protein